LRHEQQTLASARGDIWKDSLVLARSLVVGTANHTPRSSASKSTRLRWSSNPSLVRPGASAIGSCDGTWKTYQLQASVNLANWVFSGTVNGTGEMIEIEDAVAPTRRADFIGLSRRVGDVGLGAPCIRSSATTQDIRLWAQDKILLAPLLPHKCGVPLGYGTPHLYGSEELCRACRDGQDAFKNGAGWPSSPRFVS
jgi:hypothetical protein